MKSLFCRDIRAGFAAGSASFIGLLFFLAAVTLTPFALGAGKDAFAESGAALLWLFALLSILLGLDRLFQTDKEDGSLDIVLAASDFPRLAAAVCAKCAAHWVLSVLPLVCAAPLFTVLLSLPAACAWALPLSLAIGTPGVIAIGAAGAALTAALPRGGVLAAVIVLPLIIPIMIFGAATAQALAGAEQVAGGAAQPLCLLAALSLFFSLLGPAAAALILRQTAE